VTITTTPGPGAAAPAGATASGVPAGAVKMQSWYIAADGRRVRVDTPVPVDADDVRTAHLVHACPKLVDTEGGQVRRCAQQEWLLPGASRFCPTHGVALRAPRTGQRRRMLAREYLRLHGSSTTPWTVLVAAATTGAYVQTADVSTLATLTATVAAAGVTYWVTRRYLTARDIRAKRIERGQRDGRKIRRIVRTARTAAVATGLAGGWVSLAAAADPGTWAGRAVWGVLFGGWAVGAYPWWVRAERRRQAVLATPPATPQPAAQPAAPVVDPVQVRAETVWRTLIGKPGGPLAGTALTDFRQLPGCDAGPAGRIRLPNWTATVRALQPGSINMREQRPSLIGRIAAAYGCTYGDVSFAADESDLSVAYLRVQPDNLLAEVRSYRGPAVANDWRRGVSVVGRFEDGVDMRYQWWTRTGAVHTLLSGCTGSGKSEMVALLISASLHSNGLVLDWLGDPQGGQSYGVLKDVVDYFARDKTEIVFMLLAATKEMYRRNDTLAATNQKTWQPSKDLPLLVITLDEAQRYLDDPIVLELVEALVGMGRKCGIKVRLITQVPYAYALGGSIYIKEQLMAGQAFTFRAATQTAGRAAAEGDSPIDPTMLPDKWGKATCAPGETTAGLVYVQGLHGRDVYGRGDFTGHDMNVWLRDEQDALTITPGVFGPDAQQVSGVLWGGRKARYQTALAAGRSDADLLRNGKALELIDAAAQLATAQPTPTQLAAAQGTRPEAARAIDLVYTAARHAANTHPGGHAERKAILAATPTMAASTRDKAIGDLIADGRLIRVRSGVFTVPGHTPASADPASTQTAA
jgi:hypothetical protein